MELLERFAGVVPKQENLIEEYKNKKDLKDQYMKNLILTYTYILTWDSHLYTMIRGSYFIIC